MIIILEKFQSIALTERDNNKDKLPVGNDIVIQAHIFNHLRKK